MGLRDYISSTAISVNKNAIKPVQNLCFISYSYGCAAAAKIGSAINYNNAGQKLSQQLLDKDTRFTMGQFAFDFAKNATVVACREAILTLPGGRPIVEIVTRSLPKNKKLNNPKKEEIMELRSELKDQKQKIQELKVLIEKIGKENNGCSREVVKLAEEHEPSIDVDLQSKLHEANIKNAAAIKTLLNKSLYSNANKQPDDLIRDMIMKGFISDQNSQSLGP